MKPSFRRHTELALLAMRTLEAPDTPMAGADLAEAIGTTLSFLPHVMSPLVRGGWVTSGRGPGGGYRLTDAAYTASILDVIEATEGPADDGVCAMGGGPCPGTPACPIHAAWMEARQVLVDGIAGLPVVGDRSTQLTTTG